ncbi:protein kinase interacting factor [Alphabaculovirus altersperidaniae]|uniref:Protein kinase interacting factor n=1 Tax=Spodoptera eridania nucleopolyhedrovirus TaxID=2315721 RepID=A0ABX6TQY3_9ABAC|nr:protein kinase interacting factor [Spodoptera eridania nucleopolyhedrovirus]QNV47788.1 protein kinase interacting factor [Spodoptera eridania nucleopolyhedrovirus]
MQDERIAILTEKERNLKAQYENKVMAVLKKGKVIDENTKNELIIMVAEQFGIEEQLYSLRHNSTDKRRKDFINNLNELDFSNFEIEQMLEETAATNENCKVLLKKYNVATKPPAIRTTFEKNNDKFVKILKQYIEKRNVYRKCESDTLLQELVLLKCNLIKHLCVMEKLCMQ